MDYQSLSNVLGIFRLIKSSGDPNRSAADHIRTWASPDPIVSDSTILKVASYVSEQVNEALVVIQQLSLSDEAKHGVQEALTGMANAFSLRQLQNPPATSIGNLSAAISNIVILLSAGGVPTDNPTPPEALDLAKEVEELIATVDGTELDPVVRDIAKRHLQVLATLLRHCNVFGVEAALATYFDLVFKMRRANNHTPEAQQKKAKPIIERIDGLQTKLSTVDKVWNQGALWVGRAKAGAALLGFFPAGE